jgi:hypothetical protein
VHPTNKQAHLFIDSNFQAFVFLSYFDWNEMDLDNDNFVLTKHTHKKKKLFSWSRLRWLSISVAVASCFYDWSSWLPYFVYVYSQRSLHSGRNTFHCYWISLGEAGSLPPSLSLSLYLSFSTCLFWPYVSVSLLTIHYSDLRIWVQIQPTLQNDDEEKMIRDCKKVNNLFFFCYRWESVLRRCFAGTCRPLLSHTPHPLHCNPVPFC